MEFAQENHILTNYYDLESLYGQDVQKAIQESQRLICQFSNFDTFDQFLAYHRDHSHISTCQKGWQQPRMSIHCFDCSINSSSCVCLDCFLNGNHKDHNYSICPDTVGNCHCGDSSQWKPTGFCKNHHGLADDSNPENYLNEELRSTLTDFVFKAAFSALTKLNKNQDQFAFEIIQFISSFLQFGDGFRRLIAISLTEKIDFHTLLLNANKYTLQFNIYLQELCSMLMNDQIFKQNFSKTSFMIFLDFLDNQEDEIIKFWLKFFRYSFSPQSIEYNIEHNNWDWVSFWLHLCSNMKEYYNYVGNEEFSKSYPDYFTVAVVSLSYATSIQPNEQTQIFFDRLFSEVLNRGTKQSPKSDNTIITVSFKGNTEKSFYLAAQSFFLIFYNVYNCFKFKMNLKYDVLFEQLQKHTDISPIYKLSNDENMNQKENDHFILKFMKNDNASKSDDDVDLAESDGVIMYPYIYYESFHNGASFFFSCPLYESLVNIFGLENNCRIQMSKFLVDPKYQHLRMKLVIITLKKILSFVCYSQSLTSMNFGLIRMIKLEVEETDVATFGLSRYFPVFQLLIGLKCNSEKDEFSIKEFVAFEMAREIGLFDDFTSDDYKDENIKETEEKMIFSFLYLSLLLVVERILFNFDPNKFIREQLVFALKKGINSLNDLSQCYDKRVLDDFDNPVNFDNVLFDIATIKTSRKSENEESNDIEGDKDISFCLKEDVRWNTITAITPLMEQKSMLNKEISKNPEQLISIQEFEPEESYFFNAPLFSTASLTTKTFNCTKNFDLGNEIPDHEGLKIHLNEFLSTPTVLAVIYHTLRIDSSCSNLNDHLSLNILILISKFLREKIGNENNDEELLLNENVEYNSIPELISKLRKLVFKYSIDEDGNATVENTVINFKKFVSLLNLKISFSNNHPKSFIDVIRDKGEVGKTALNMMSINPNENNPNDNSDENKEKMIKKQRANKIKEDIMNKYQNIILNYHASDHRNLSGLSSIESLYSPSCSGIINGLTEVCSVCSTNKKNEVLSYPIFFYQTKLPFIFDKPPLLKGREEEISVSCDDDVDYDSDDEDEVEDQEGNENDSMLLRMEEEEELEHLQDLQRRFDSINTMTRQLIEARASGQLSQEDFGSVLAAFQQAQHEVRMTQEAIKRASFIRQVKRRKKALKEQHRKQRQEEHKANPDMQKRYTAGANFTVQFSLCQHLIHPQCVETDVFHCPIDRTLKNGFLPCFEFSQIDLPLSTVMANSVNVFLESFEKMIAPSPTRKIDIFVELVKSLSGLITTYEIRLRNLPLCLDTNNNKLLSFNLFITAWHAYRIKGKPRMDDVKPYRRRQDENSNEDVEVRLTLFQRFIKKLIENDDINGLSNSLNEIVGPFISQIINERSERTEKELLLFLRRVRLSDYFLLEGDVTSGSSFHMNCNFIEWDEVLSIQNISKKFNVTFQFLKDDFEFRPFLFSKLPKEFLHFALKPYNFPIEKTSDMTFYNLIDYNYLIDNYDDFDEKEFDFAIQKSATYKESDVKIELALNHNLKRYPSALLLIGKFASRVLVIFDSFTTTLNPFYLDKYGSPDFGFSRKKPLFLNEERYERFIDEILSGDFSNFI